MRTSRTGKEEVHSKTQLYKHALQLMLQDHRCDALRREDGGEAVVEALRRMAFSNQFSGKRSLPWAAFDMVDAET